MKTIAAVSGVPVDRGRRSPRTRAAPPRRSASAQSTRRTQSVSCHDAPVTDHGTVNRANWDERAPAHAASAGLRARPVPRRPGPPERRRALRPAAARRRRRPRRRAPPVPHRHRHDLARAARRADDRARLLARLARRGARGSRDGGDRRRVRRVRCLRRRRRPRRRARSTSSTPASARSAGCRRPPLGRGRRRGCSAPAAGSSSARATRCSGRSTSGRTGWSIEYPYFETAEPLVWDEPGTYVETDVEFTQNVTHEWNHGLGEIVTALLAAGMELTVSSSTTSVP